MRFITVLIFTFLSISSWSQTITYDTIMEVKEVDGYLDTIYYVKQHVQINKEFVVVDTVRGNQWAFDVYFGTLLLAGDCPYTEPNLKYQSSSSNGYHFGGTIYYNLPKKWSFRVGAQFTQQTTTSNYSQGISYTEDVTQQVNDTLDTYFNIIGSDTSYFHIIESNTVTTTEDRVNTQYISYTWETWYLEIPLQISYGIEKGKWAFNVLAGTSLGFQLQNVITDNEFDNPTNVNFNFSTNLLLSGQLGYFIGNTTILQFEPRYKNRLNNTQNSVLPSNEFHTTIGIKHFF